MRKIFLPYLTVILLLFGGVTSTSGAEASPWNSWRKGYECYDRAGAFRNDNQLEQALELYQQSCDHFSAIRKNFPDWNSSVVEGRIKLCRNEIEEVKKLLRSHRSNAAASSRSINNTDRTMPEVHPADQDRSHRNSAAGSRSSLPSRVAGNRSSSYDDDFGSVPARSGNRLYIEMQSEIDQYRRKLRAALQEIDSLQLKLQQNESRSRDIDGVLRDYRTLQDKYSLLEMQYKDALKRAEGGDRERYQSTVSELRSANDNAQARLREQENELKVKDQEYAVSRTEVLQLRDELQKLKSDNQRLKRDAELQRARAARSNNSELTAKVSNLESELKRKDQRIERMMRLLSESSNDGSSVNTALAEEVKQLQGELDELRRNSGMESELRRRISTLTAAESDLQKQLADSAELMNLRNSELLELQRSERKLKHDLDLLQRKAEQQQKQLSSSENELKNSLNKYAELERRYQDRLQSDAANQDKFRQEKQAAERTAMESKNLLREKTDELAALQKELNSARELVKEARAGMIELTAKQQSGEVELSKMKALRQAYDELKQKFELISQASSSDVLTSLNRIPALEESLRRYEKENNKLIGELAKLKQALGKTPDKNNVAVLADSELEHLETLLADARSAAARGNHEIAMWGYRQVLARDSGNQAAAAELGTLYLKEQKFEDAAKLLTLAIKNDPDNEKLVDALARSEIGKRNYNGALDLLTTFKAKRQGRASAPLLLSEAVAWSRSGNRAKAENAFRVVLQIDTANIEAAYELALMLSADKARLREAGEFYMLAKSNGLPVDSYLEEILRSVGNNDNATRDFLLKNAADALKSNDPASAGWYLAEAAKLFPQDKEVKLMQALLDLLQKRPADVIKQFSGVDGAEEKLLLTLALLQNNELERAAEAVKTSVAISKTRLPSEVIKKFIDDNKGAEKTPQYELYNTLSKKLP